MAKLRSTSDPNKRAYHLRQRRQFNFLKRKLSNLPPTSMLPLASIGSLGSATNLAALFDNVAPLNGPFSVDVTWTPIPGASKVTMVLTVSVIGTFSTASPVLGKEISLISFGSFPVGTVIAAPSFEYRFSHTVEVDNTGSHTFSWDVTTPASAGQFSCDATFFVPLEPAEVVVRQSVAI